MMTPRTGPGRFMSRVGGTGPAFGPYSREAGAIWSDGVTSPLIPARWALRRMGSPIKPLEGRGDRDPAIPKLGNALI